MIRAIEFTGDEIWLPNETRITFRLNTPKYAGVVAGDAVVMTSDACKAAGYVTRIQSGITLEHIRALGDVTQNGPYTTGEEVADQLEQLYAQNALQMTFLALEIRVLFVEVPFE